ncbi:MAG: hypothetical protein LBH68_04690 [Bifidobacteriaceae bacterium]|jgi:hypothetical protein|nr:hypothetical protein [Bifidobacteriaceae bacterium]
MGRQPIHNKHLSHSRHFWQRLGAVGGALGLAVAGVAVSAPAANAATGFTCEPTECTVTTDASGNVTYTIQGDNQDDPVQVSLNGVNTLEANETIVVGYAAELWFENGSSLTGAGKLINYWDMLIVGPTVHIGVDTEMGFDPDLGSAGMWSQDVGVTVYFDNANLINNGLVHSRGDIFFTGDLDTGQTSKLINNADGTVHNEGHMYFLMSEVDNQGTWDAAAPENKPLFAALYGSWVDVSGSDDLATACAPTFQAIDSTDPVDPTKPWWIEDSVDGAGLAYMYEGFQFKLTAAENCTYDGQSYPFQAWGGVTGSIEGISITDVAIESQTAVLSRQMPGGPLTLVAVYAPKAPTPLPPTGASVSPQVAGGAGLLIGIGVLCLVMAARRRRALI